MLLSKVGLATLRRPILSKWSQRTTAFLCLFSPCPTCSLWCKPLPRLGLNRRVGVHHGLQPKSNLPSQVKRSPPRTPRTQRKDKSGKLLSRMKSTTLRRPVSGSIRKATAFLCLFSPCPSCSLWCKSLPRLGLNRSVGGNHGFSTGSNNPGPVKRSSPSTPRARRERRRRLLGLGSMRKPEEPNAGYSICINLLPDGCR